MWSGSECATFMSQLIIRLLHQAGPLNAFDLYFCVTSLFLLLSPVSHPFIHYFSIILWPFLTLLISLPPLFFVLFNRSSLSPNNLFSLNIIFSLFLHFIFSLLFAHTSTLFLTFYSLLFVNPHSPPFAFLSHRPFSGQCGHHRRGASAPAGSGAVSPWGVCKCLLPWFAGAAEPRRELHTHPGLSALWHG